jgi:hypothetical protein
MGNRSVEQGEGTLGDNRLIRLTVSPVEHGKLT